MTPVYSKNFSVQLHDINLHGVIKPSGFFNIFQSTSSEQSSSLGIPITELIKRKLTWVVSRYHLKVKAYPRWKDEVTVSTWRSEKNDRFAPREFEVKDKSDKQVAVATSSFMLIDLVSRKPVSPLEKFPFYPILEKRVLHDDFKPLESFELPDSESYFQVRKHDLDVNRHVNNTLYIEWALESVPDDVFDGFLPTEIEVAFRGEAFYGDTVISLIKRIKQGPETTFLHRLLRQSDGMELTRLKTAWKKK